jgi:hypothetical protein
MGLKEVARLWFRFTIGVQYYTKFEDQIDTKVKLGAYCNFYDHLCVLTIVLNENNYLFVFMTNRGAVAS